MVVSFHANTNRVRPDTIDDRKHPSGDAWVEGDHGVRLVLRGAQVRDEPRRLFLLTGKAGDQ